MPKPLFDKLSPEKKQPIEAAAFDEFSNYDFHAASINRIVKSAGIARGSFYLYFEDKADLYFYLIEDFLHETAEKFSGNDAEKTIAERYRALLTYNLTLLEDARYSELMKRLYQGMDYALQVRFKATIAKVRQAYFPEKAVHPETASLMMLFEWINRELLSKKILEGQSDAQILSAFDGLIMAMHQFSAHV
jgi:AcrR family transcriptional regulator